MEYKKSVSKRYWLNVLSLPFIWLPFPFILMLDLVTVLYMHVCFPLYGLEKVKRADYILILDRNKLQYLSGLEKIACMYCGYGNGVLRYLKEIAGRTEKYWCGVMHEDKPGFIKQQDQVSQKFAKFGDEEEFKKKYPIN